MTKKLIVLRGIPASGKTTLAREFYKSAIGSVVILSTDSNMSDSLDNYLFSSDYLGLAHKLNQLKVEEACKRGILTVICDNTNTTAKEIRPYYNIAMKYGYEFELVEPNTPWKNDVEECYRRSTHSVLLETIRKMKQRYQTNDQVMDLLKEQSITIVSTVPTYDKTLPYCIICDLDGTLANIDQRISPYDASQCDITDTLNEAVGDILRVYSNDNNLFTENQEWIESSNKVHIILMSGREDKDRAATERFLNKYKIQYDALYMRKTGDHRRDSIVKRELFDQYIKDKYYPMCVFEDRLQVIRECWNQLDIWVFNCNQTLTEF